MNRQQNTQTGEGNAPLREEYDEQYGQWRFTKDTRHIGNRFAVRQERNATVPLRALQGFRVDYTSWHKQRLKHETFETQV